MFYFGEFISKIYIRAQQTTHLDVIKSVLSRQVKEIKLLGEYMHKVN